MTVFYRDVGIVIGHLMRLLFWISPILWSFHAAAGRGQALRDAVGETGFALLSYNPVALLLDAYRTVIYGGLARDQQGVLVWTTRDRARPRRARRSSSRSGSSSRSSA